VLLAVSLEASLHMKGTRAVVTADQLASIFAGVAMIPIFHLANCLVGPNLTRHHGTTRVSDSFVWRGSELVDDRCLADSLGDRLSSGRVLSRRESLAISSAIFASWRVTDPLDGRFLGIALHIKFV
jgi:hypothetical protein